MRYREERTFTVQLHLAAGFDDGYEGDEDGYAWFERFEGVVKPRLVRAIFEALRSDPGWKVTAAPRGRDPGEYLEIEVERTEAASPPRGTPS
jgi:hypothetical protein